jgi:type I restriction enzyme S subunit
MSNDYGHRECGVILMDVSSNDWPEKRLRFCLRLNPSKQEIRHLPKDTELSFVPMEAVGEDGSLDLSNTRLIEEVENGYTYFRNDDVAIAKITPCFENGKGCVFRNLNNDYGFGTTELTVMRPSSLSPAFLYYLTISHRFRVTGIGLMQGSAGQKRVPDDYIRNYIIGLPSELEQHAIASFLDRETTKIDALIQKKERMIELLKEKRIALITQAVTKGLDPSVPMKNSGIEWLGEVPEHWEVKRIKHIARRIQTGCTPPTSNEQYYEEGSIHWFGPSSFTDDLYLTDPVKIINESSVADGVARLFKKGSIMMVGIGATIGKIAQITMPASCNQQITIVTLKSSECNPDYYTYLLKTMENTIRGIAPSATLAIFDQGKIGSLSVLRPPLKEQVHIAEFLSDKINDLQLMMSKISNSITLLREYRASIIHHAVTGKIDLRGYDAKAQ